MKNFLCRLLPLMFLLGLSATKAVGQPTYAKLSSAELLSTMKEEGYAVTLDSDGDVIWTTEGDKALVIRSSDGESITFKCSFTNSSNVTLKKINDWNAAKRFSRSYLDKKNDMVISLDLDLAGGITKARILDFLTTCKLSLNAWKKHVTE